MHKCSGTYRLVVHRAFYGVGGILSPNDGESSREENGA